MARKIKITESQLNRIINRVLSEEESKAEEKKVESRRELKKSNQFIKEAQFMTEYACKLDPKDRSILIVKKPQSDETMMEIDLGFVLKDCDVNIIEHDTNKIILKRESEF